MAAGAFGRSLAGAFDRGCRLEHGDDAAPGQRGGAGEAGGAEDRRGRGERGQLKVAKAEQDKAAGAATASTEAELKTLQDDAKAKTEVRQKAQGELNAAEEMLSTTLTAQADSQAWGAVTAGGKIEGRAGTVDATAIKDIAANYVGDYQGIDALMIACISELSRMRKETNGSGLYGAPVSELVEKCLNNSPAFFTLVGLGLLKEVNGEAADINNFADLLEQQELYAERVAGRERAAPARVRPRPREAALGGEAAHAPCAVRAANGRPRVGSSAVDDPTPRRAAADLRDCVCGSRGPDRGGP